VVTVGGVASNGVSFTILPTPNITSLSPASGGVGASVTITGTNFGLTQGTSTVTFNGTTATTITSWNATSIVATVPTGATTGNVVVVVSGVVSNGSWFTVASNIVSLAPTSGATGASVTITGANFGTTQGTSTVTFNGTTAASIANWSATSITVTVPTGATTGNVVVTVDRMASNSIAFGVCARACADYGNGYQYRQTIVLGHANVPNTDQVNFPVLISGVYPYLANVSNGGLVQSANGYDIVFSSDPEGGNPLNYETGTYDPVTGTVNFWVSIPTLSHTTDTIIYLFYGNSSITSDQSNKTAVWDANYVGVWHLPNGTTLTANDSTSNGRNGTISGVTATAGQIDGGASFNGSSIITIPTIGSLAGPFTIEEWASPGSTSATLGLFGSRSPSDESFDAKLTGGLVHADIGSGSGWLNTSADASFSYSVNSWHDFVYAVSDTGYQIFADGASIGSGSFSGTPLLFDSNHILEIGGTGYGGEEFVGAIDEVRVSSTIRSADWIATEYANESSPSTFYTIEGQATAYSAPTIQFLSPAAGLIGSSAMIQGFGFQSTQGASTVTFNGVTATPTSWNDASIIVPVPVGATNGNVIVTVGSVQSNGVSFTVLATPSITGLSPASAGVGASVTITGTNFGSTQGTSTMTFNGTTATTITSWNATSIVAMVPTGATTGNVVVTVSGIPSAGVNFTVLPTPGVSSLSPAAGPVGTQVAISGSNFGSTQGTSVVSFDGASAASIVSWSATQIVAVAPITVTTGPVTVVVNSVPSNASVVFTAYNPVITSISPPSGPVGGTVTIYGSGFGASQDGVVSFNGADAGVQSWSDTAVQVSVPGTTSGPVTLTMNGVTSNGVEFTVEAPPAITTISPTSGAVGAAVTINGSGFGSTQSTNTVAFNGALATVNSWSDTEIIAVVPTTTTGPVTVTVAGITAQGPNFTFDTIAALTNSNGYQTTYTSTMVGGVWVTLSAQGPGCSSCSMRGNLQYTYDGYGNVLTSTDANGNTNTYTYDGNNNILSRSAQLNGSAVTTSYTYNSFGEVLTMTDPLGNTTTNTYDANGNLLTVSSPAPNGQTSPSVTQFAYNTLGELTQITDPLSHITTLTYYPTGLIQSITDAQNNTTSYTYDARGNRTGVIDPINGSAHPTTFTFNVMNHLTGITYPDGTSGSFTYDYRGRRITATDQNGKTTTYVYDDADRLLSVTDPANNVTQYNYDTESNLLSITDANNHTTYFSYDALGRVTQTTFPSSLVETYGYDSFGNLTSKTDRKGNTIQYVYDSLYRLTSKTYPDSTVANYVYDLVGKIQQVSDPTGTYAFAYDNMGRLIGTTTQYSFLTGHNFQNSYTYDAASNRTSLTAPDGSTNTYSYDTLNRLTTLTSSLTGQFGFGYDALSRKTQLTRPNNVTTNYTYDGLSHLLSVLHQAGSTTLDGASYGYDYAGNRTSKTNYLNGTTSNYGYDAIYELLQVTQGGSTTESYSYDAVGNRLSSSGVPSYSYNSSNELTSNSSGNYTYDASGNTLSDPSGKSYSWDFENRLTQAVVPGTNGGTTTFKYDPFGRRIEKISPSFTSVFVYDGSNLIETVNGSGAEIANYTQTQNIDEPLAELRGSTADYYEGDGLGSITSLSGSAGTIANTYTYDSFGNLTASTGTARNYLQYTGREFDPETGIYEYRARYYAPVIGRFISEDQSGFQGGLNFYKYVQNNPLLLNDPTGLSPQGAWGTATDLWCYSWGEKYCNTYHSNDAVTAELSNSGAMADIQNKFQKNHCASGLYCGAFGPKQVLTTWNLTGQTVGGFCAYMTNLGDGETQVDAYNDWGAASGSRNPTANRNNPSLWDMIVNGKPWGNPSSLWNDWYGGPLGVKEFWYHWTEKTPCCGN
jgi:RHS repeat-associated protein